MKSKLKLLALLPILSLTLTACNLQDLPGVGQFLPDFEIPNPFDGSKTSEPASLKMWGMWEPPDVYSGVIQSYSEQNPNVSVSYENRNLQTNLVEYKERAFERADDASGPDILMVHSSWVSRMVASGLLAPAPEELVTVETFNETYYPVAAEELIVNNQVYAIPAYYDGLALVYNREHFEEIGQTSPPTAWEEFRRLALNLTKKENDVVVRYGAAMGASKNIDHFSDILGLMWAQADVRIPEDIDTLAAQDALTFYTNFILEDQVWTSNQAEATTAFVNGDVSMIMVPSWQILRILENIDDPAKVGVAPVPQAIPTNPRSWASFWVYVVPAKENTEAAWNFVGYISQEEQVRTLFDAASQVRLFGAPYARVSMAGDLYNNDYLRPILDTAQYAKSAEISGLSGNRRQVDALSEAVESVLGGGSAEKALEEAKSAVAQ